jgi:acetolactate synthase I/III small subunit
VNVLWVDDLTHKQSVSRVLALIKVTCTHEQRPEVLQVCEVFGARAIDMSPERMMIEITAPQEKVDGLVSVLRPFGILEMFQTGTVAMTRGVEKHDLAHPTVLTSRITAV